MDDMQNGGTEVWNARSDAWNLLALSFRYPEKHLAEAVASGLWARAANDLQHPLGLRLPAGFADDATCGETDSGALLHVLRVEATRLFMGMPEPEVSPYEGVWRDTVEGREPLLYASPYTIAVEDFCHECGLGHPRGTNEPLDYIATEFELLGYLASKAAVEMRDPAVSTDSQQALYQRFYDEHLSAWAVKFADAVMAETSNPFYQSASVLLRAILDGENSKMEMQRFGDEVQA